MERYPITNDSETLRGIRINRSLSDSSSHNHNEGLQGTLMGLEIAP